MSSYPESEPPWERPRGRGMRRAAWVGAAAVVVAAVGVAVSGGGAEEDRVAEESPWLPVKAIALTDDAAWLGTDRGVVQAPR